MRFLICGALFFFACGGNVSKDPAAEPPSGGQPCTAVGCVDGFMMSLPNTGWKPGNYVFTITADGAEQVCKGALPLPPCGTRGLTCTGDVGAQIGESGCALPPASHGFADIQLKKGPEKVSLRIERDGAVLAKESFTPAYKTSQPNGPNCGPVCRQASATIKVAD